MQTNYAAQVLHWGFTRLTVRCLEHPCITQDRGRDGTDGGRQERVRQPTYDLVDPCPDGGHQIHDWEHAVGVLPVHEAVVAFLPSGEVVLRESSGGVEGIGIGGREPIGLGDIGARMAVLTFGVEDLTPPSWHGRI